MAQPVPHDVLDARGEVLAVMREGGETGDAIRREPSAEFHLADPQSLKGRSFGRR